MMQMLAAELRDSTDFPPKLILACACFGGVRQDSFDLEMLGQLPDGVLKLIVRDAVALGSYDNEGTVLGAKPFDELFIAAVAAEYSNRSGRWTSTSEGRFSRYGSMNFGHSAEISLEILA